jgi:hypothetical protein
LSWKNVENRWRGTTSNGHDEKKEQQKRSKIRNNKKKSVPGVDLGKNLSLIGIVVTSEVAILHAETIAPEGKTSYRGLLSWLVGDTGDI